MWPPRGLKINRVAHSVRRLPEIPFAIGADSGRAGERIKVTEAQWNGPTVDMRER